MTKPILDGEEPSGVALHEDDELDDLMLKAEAHLKSEQLEDEVRDLHTLDAEQSASAINKAGVKAQIAYIWNNYGPAYTVQVLNQLLKKD